MDAWSVVDIRDWIARQLPNVRSAVYEDETESLTSDTDQVFDVVIVFHCVSYNVPESAHRLPLNRLFEPVIKPNGFS